MCIYLLRMQEHYRWKNEIPFNGSIDTDALGNWVRETEDYWDTIEETEFRPITIAGQAHDPFDTNAINHALSDTGLAYTAGTGRLGQPHFVLAECVERTRSPYPQIELGKELARDSITVPAMTRQGTIVIRQDGIKQMLWQMIAEWQLRQPEGPMKRLLQHYNIVPGQAHSLHIEQTAKALSPLLVHHERGEIMATEQLGADYPNMIAALHGRPAEGYVRAVGDLMADTLGTWPFILHHQSAVHLDFWLAGLQGIRDTLLATTPLYAQLTDNQNDNRLQALNAHLAREQQRWCHTAKLLLQGFNHSGVDFDFKSIIKNATTNDRARV